MGFSPVEADIQDRPELDESTVGFVTSYTVGANLDFKLGWNTGAIFPNNKTYWFVQPC